MNNKGFAITGILYGTMIVFFMVVASFLGVLSSKKKLLESATNNIKEAIELKSIITTPQVINLNVRYITPVSGKYNFSFNYPTDKGCTGDLFLSKDTLIILKSTSLIEINKVEINIANLCTSTNNTSDYLLSNVTSTKSAVNTFKINTIFSANN